ncbi:MAG TPA: Asp-tRNA(Asn)/Glu-tRNA(Gln) amidotransferase subunit GatB [Candidatus Paceibacterota bacterium]|nr:Asp-tRNA(Asn)/Glu-tRNA(Gln) amidotransferase subunit GatB [Candidatus Paceibacterota bacterium]
MKTYTPTIGIEVHAELKTRTKMFCDSKNEPHDAEPNTNVCPICMGHPGTLPTINRQAVEHVLKVGMALGSELASYTEFDRKNYFYPDIPKGYQISQYEYPLVKGGTLAGVAITRVHLEEDTARSLHDQGEGSVIDYNRAGVPLMELVTEPVIHDAKAAGDFARELQLLLRTLGVSDANMERGEMRVEANISVSDSDTFGTKVEVKNLNSFKSVEGAIEYEVRRQIEAIERGEQVIQETRGWDEAKGKTYSQRVKESAHDYRYFPEPDLPKLSVDEALLSRIRESMPELPAQKREKYSNLGLTTEQISVIISDAAVDSFFSRCVESAESDGDLVRLSANYLVTDLLTLVDDTGRLDKAHADLFFALMRMVHDSRVTSRVAKDILEEVVIDGADPEVIAKDRGLLQSSSDEALLPIVDEVIGANKTVADDFEAGKEAALQYLVGQGMKLSRGSANPKVLADLFRKRLG